MKETGLRSRTYVVPVVVAAGLGMAGMGLLSDGVVKADTTSATDTINVTVQPSCTFTNVSDETYAGSAANGTQVNNFNDNGQHVFNLFCNDHNGFEVSATAYDLEATGVEDVIAYTDNYTHTGVNSMWTAGITSSSTGVTVVPIVPVGGGTIFSSDTNTSAAGVSFTATYSAYVGTATPAGTYTGTIVYTLTASGTSNSNSGSGGSGTGDNSGSQQDNNGGGDNSGANSGNEETGTGDNSGTGAGDNSGSGSNPDANSGSGSNPSNANSTPSNTNAAPLSMNSFYNTYNTSNTTNTYNTNYSGGSSAPAATSGQTATIDTNDTTGNDTTNSNNSGAGDSYEQPLGVMSTTSSSSDSNTGMDPMPIVAAGALTMAGVAAIALARSSKKEEE